MKKTAQKISATTQKFIEIQDIVDNVVILASGNASLIIQVTATNFDLLSQQEKDARVFSYASLLNSLSFPIQIFIRSKRIDISSYLKLLREETRKTSNQMLKAQIEKYHDFVQELVKVNIVLDKKFYIVLSYSYLEGGISGVAQKGKKGFDFLTSAKTSLKSKEESILSQLGRLNLSAKTLNKEDLVKLFYETYNTDTEVSQITDTIKAPFVKTGGII